MIDHLMPVYNRAAPLFVEGKGVWLYTDNGEAYLDCVSGVATNALGHANPVLSAALKAQADRLWHISNMFRIEGQERLAARLTGACFADTVFFTNSGAESVECALKTARRYHQVRGDHQRTVIHGFAGAFHGRSYATINAAGNSAYLDGFGPRLPGYNLLSLDDRDAMVRAIADPATAAVIVEPVQGEGGARALGEALLRDLRTLCTAHGVLLIFDEVQCGMGRTGQLFAHQWYDGLAPDIMAIAKAMGGGFPVGACLATKDAASGMTVGTHGSTYGGNPLAMAVANAAFDEIARPDRLAHVRALSDHLRGGLQKLHVAFPSVVTGLRGQGLLLGIGLAVNNRAFMALARDQKLLLGGGGDNIVRMLPPLTMTMDEASEALERFAGACMVARDLEVQAA